MAQRASGLLIRRIIGGVLIGLVALIVVAILVWRGDILRSGLDPEQATSQAKLWAEEFTAKGEGEFTIEVPVPDEPFDQRVMVSYESGASSGSMDVKAVKTWCIKDGSGRISKKAEVTTF